MLGFRRALVPSSSSNLVSLKRPRDAINMPGCNPNILADGAKKQRTLVGNNVGRPNPDTPQNVVSTTAIMMTPPGYSGIDIDPKSVYAPASMNAAQANIPNRGEIAVTCDASTMAGRDWISQTMGATFNSNCNAIPVFTNMANVPKGVRIKYAGIVGNAGKHSKNPQDSDNYGNVYSAGCVTTNNTGPEYIPPLTPVYISPYPYTRKDSSGRDVPGYKNPGADAAGIDKWLVSVHAIKTTDTSVFMHHIEATFDALAKSDRSKFANPGWIKQKIDELGIHDHVPVFRYIEHYAKQAHFLEMLAALTDSSDKAFKLGLIKAYNMVIKQNKVYWDKTDIQQREMTEALGALGLWSKRTQSMDLMELVPETDDSKVKDQAEKVVANSTKLVLTNLEIFKLVFSEQMNFIRSQCFGISRYGCASTQQLDVMTGYRLG